MKYTLLPALALAGLVHAAPFTGQGVPASAGGIVHLDLEVAGESPLVKTLTEIAEASAAANAGAGKSEAVETLKAELGVDAKSLHDLTVAVIPAETPGSEPKMVFRMRGAFNRAKFESLAKNHQGLVAHKSGKHTWYSVDDLNKAFGGKELPKDQGKSCLCMTDDRTTLIVNDESLLPVAIAAAEGKGAYKPDTAAKALFAGKPMLAGYFPESFIKAVKPASPPAAPGGKPPSEVTSVVFSLNDTAGTLALHADAKYDSPAGAREINSQATMMIGFLGMGLAQAKDGETEAQAQDRAFAAQALQALKFSANGDTFSTHFSFPSEQLVAKLNEKRADILAAIAAQAQAQAQAKPAASAATPTRRAKKTVAKPTAE